MGGRRQSQKAPQTHRSRVHQRPLRLDRISGKTLVSVAELQRVSVVSSGSVVLHILQAPALKVAVDAPVLCLPQMDDASIFPQHYGEPFPPAFQGVICAIFKRLFRVYAHIYHSHFKHVCALDEEAHLNTCFKHFMYFTQVGPIHSLLCSAYAERELLAGLHPDLAKQSGQQVMLLCDNGRTSANDCYSCLNCRRST